MVGTRLVAGTVVSATKPALPRRTALLASALSAGVLAVTMLTPATPAWAQCAPAGGPIVDCTSGAGILDATGTVETVNVQANQNISSKISITGPGGIGNPSPVAIEYNQFANSLVNGGVNLESQKTVTVNIDGGTITGVNFDGLRLRAGGDIDATISGNIFSGDGNSQGIDAASDGGNVTIDLQQGSVIATFPNANQQAIVAQTTGAGNIDISIGSEGPATVDGWNTGIWAFNKDAGATGSIDITIGEEGSVHSSTANAILVQSAGTGPVTVENRGEIVASDDGAVLILAKGDVTFDGTGGSVESTNAGFAGAAILALSSEGDVTVDTGEVTANGTGGGAGAIALGTGQTATVNVTGDISIGAGLAGAAAIATDGNAVANVNEAVTIEVDTFAIAAVGSLSLGGGDAETNVNEALTLDGSGIIVAGAAAIALDGNATTNVDAEILVEGKVLVAALAVAGGADNLAEVNVNEKITEADTAFLGAGAVAVGFDDADATVNVNADIDPPLIGAAAVTFGAGDATVTVADGVLVEADLVGLVAANLFGDGDVTVEMGADSHVVSGGIGIVGAAILSDGKIGISLGEDASVTADDDGIFVFAFKGGVVDEVMIDIELGDGATVASANGNGITVLAPLHKGDVAITTGVDSAVVSLTGSAVQVDTFSVFTDNDVVVENAGTLVGRGDIADNAVVDIFTDGEILVVNTGVIAAFDSTKGADGEIVHADIALDLDSPNFGSVVVNDGVIVGRMLLTFNDDLVVNSGEWYVEGFNGFGFTNDELYNTGLIAANTQTDGSVTIFAGLDLLDNDGGTISQLDDDPTDLLVTTGDYFGGSASGEYWIDAFLTADGALIEADLLVIGGEASGVTYVSVNNTNGQPVGYDPDGVLIIGVGSTGVEAGDTFQIAEPVDVGFFEYFVDYEPVGAVFNEEFYLRNRLSPRAEELPRLTTATQELFHISNETWLQRTADIRIFTNPGVGGTDADVNRAESGYTDGSPGFWLRGWGSWLDRGGRTGYDQDSWGVQAGIDFPLTQPNNPGGTFVLGALVGYADSRIDFHDSRSRADIDGFQVGVYGTYMLDGFFVDLLLKAEFLDLDYRTNFGAGVDRDSTSVTNLGAVLDTGYRFDFDGFFVEPQGTLAYVHSDMGNLDLLESNVSLSNEDSLRGRLGVRIGGRFMPTSATVIEPFVGISLWHEFLGDNDATLTSNGTSFSLRDDAGDTWGVATAGVNIVDFGSGMSGFVQGDYRFGGHTDGISGQAGLRVNF